MRLVRRLLIVVLGALVVALAVAVTAEAVRGPRADDSGALQAPRIGRDHWHATYQIFVCGQRQPNLPFWEGGVHTHADGVIHIHPFSPAEEGEGARLVKFFEYGGGRLTQTELRMPGSGQTFKNGDECPDGSEVVLQVFVNGERMKDWSRYVPQDGDRVRIVFGPAEEVAPTPQAPPQETPTPPR